jgi:hypothetical protein
VIKISDEASKISYHIKKRKSETSLALITPFLLLPTLTFLPLYISLILVVFGFVAILNSKKSEVGQSQLLLSLFAILLSLGIVIATNSTTNGSFTQILATSSTKTTEKVALLEVWANTSINLEINQSFAKALLLLDNGTSLQGQEIKFYLNDTLLGSSITDSQGYATIDLNLTNGFYFIKAVFEGNSSLYLNPSEAIREIEIKENVSIIPRENITQLNDTKAPTILNERVNSTSAFVNESIRLSVEIFDDVGVKNVSFVIIKPRKEILEVSPVNENSLYYYDLTLDEVGNYIWLYVNATDASDNFNFTQPNITFEAKALQKIIPEIEASVSVKNVTKGKIVWKSVVISGNVSFNGSLIASNISLRIKDPKGSVIFEDRQTTQGSFSFTFEFLPKVSGSYLVEIFAESEFGNTSKTFDFNVLKHIKVKPKIKQEKFNYELGEKIKFEILAIDEDTGELYPNATLKAFVVDPDGNVAEVNYTQVGPGKFVVELDAEREFRPGLYKLKVKLGYTSPNPGEEVVEEEISFAVGLVNVNTDRSIYLPGENATITVGVLDSQGHRVPGANVSVIVISPSGEISYFSTSLGNIRDRQDGTYVLNYQPKEIGNYTIKALLLLLMLMPNMKHFSKLGNLENLI